MIELVFKLSILVVVHTVRLLAKASYCGAANASYCGATINGPIWVWSEGFETPVCTCCLYHNMEMFRALNSGHRKD